MSRLPDIANIRHIAMNVLPHVHSLEDMWFFTDHGIEHSERVEQYIDRFIDLCKQNSNPLSEEEQIILKCSCWLHDLGCIRSRELHARESVKIIKLLVKENLLDLCSVQKEVEYVVHAHSKNGLPLESVPKRSQGSIRLKFLCALFMLADECDIDRRRAPVILYNILKDKMPCKSTTWRVGHNNTLKIDFSESGEIIVYLENIKNKKITKSLIGTVAELRTIFEENEFPYVTCKVEALQSSSE